MVRICRVSRRVERADLFACRPVRGRYRARKKQRMKPFWTKSHRTSCPICIRSSSGLFGDDIWESESAAQGWIRRTEPLRGKRRSCQAVSVVGGHLGDNNNKYLLVKRKRMTMNVGRRRGDQEGLLTNLKQLRRMNAEEERENSDGTKERKVGRDTHTSTTCTHSWKKDRGTMIEGKKDERRPSNST